MPRGKDALGEADDVALRPNAGALLLTISSLPIALSNATPHSLVVGQMSGKRAQPTGEADNVALRPNAGTCCLRSLFSVQTEDFSILSSSLPPQS